jgi:hypothetical protein
VELVPLTAADVVSVTGGRLVEGDAQQPIGRLSIVRGR